LVGFSLIMPVYNEEKDSLADTISQLFRIPWPENGEIIVVDDNWDGKVNDMANIQCRSADFTLLIPLFSSAFPDRKSSWATYNLYDNYKYFYIFADFHFRTDYKRSSSLFFTAFKRQSAWN